MNLITIIVMLLGSLSSVSYSFARASMFFGATTPANIALGIASSFGANVVVATTFGVTRSTVVVSGGKKHHLAPPLKKHHTESTVKKHHPTPVIKKHHPEPPSKKHHPEPPSKKHHPEPPSKKHHPEPSSKKQYVIPSRYYITNGKKHG
eukprot:TRINITY_DN525_c0_g1_i6.p1 TRINITY_DN525_c0_g1~~TRINITY_DN525_c0_g1_i6.p1  ORF type:complete len:149 (-),score=25.74 TRINITY_DN525_c0_g1_i6:108-554(-)